MGSILYSFSLLLTYFLATDSAPLSNLSYLEIALTLLLVTPVVVSFVFGVKYFEKHLGYFWSAGIILAGMAAGFLMQGL